MRKTSRTDGAGGAQPPHLERFDRWAAPYEQGFSWRHLFRRVHEHLLATYPAWQGQTVLDVGCGTGSLALQLWERGAAVTGVDASEGMISIAEERAQGRDGLRFLRARASALPMADASCDTGVTSIERSIIFLLQEAHWMRYTGCSGRKAVCCSATCAERDGPGGFFSFGARRWAAMSAISAGRKYRS